MSGPDTPVEATAPTGTLDDTRAANERPEGAADQHARGTVIGRSRRVGARWSRRQSPRRPTWRRSALALALAEQARAAHGAAGKGRSARAREEIDAWLSARRSPR